MIAATIAKIQANYTCQECGNTEFVQAHHQIPGDDTSLISLCGNCHSQKHPEIPRALFFSINLQRYWYNKSAASLAKQFGVHSRTITRIAKKINIPYGFLSEIDELLIKGNIKKKGPQFVYPSVNNTIVEESNGYYTIKEAAKILKVCTNTVYKWSKSGHLPAVKIGGQWFISQEELARLFQSTGAGLAHAAGTGNTAEERAQVADPAPEL